MKPLMKLIGSLLCSLALALSIKGAEVFEVKIIHREDTEGKAWYSIPARSQTTEQANVNCTGGANTANCSGNGQSTTYTRPAVSGSYAVNGAALWLQLPDRRRAVVRCDHKTNWTSFSPSSKYRSCKVPPVDSLKAEFSGKKAKLMWPVSVDGKKFESETYEIVAISDKKY
jgi:hypothetical protein